jgi:hypothetical protein
MNVGEVASQISGVTHSVRIITDRDPPPPTLTWLGNSVALSGGFLGWRPGFGVEHEDLDQSIGVKEDLAVVADDLAAQDVFDAADEFGGDDALKPEPVLAYRFVLPPRIMVSSSRVKPPVITQKTYSSQKYVLAWVGPRP